LALIIAPASAHDAPNDERLPTIGLAQDVTLTSQDGARVSLRDFRGDQRRPGRRHQPASKY
jgi:protein SCO1/2